MSIIKKAWGTLKNILIKIGRIQTSLFMGLIYYLVIGPMAFLYQLFRQEKKSEETYWKKKEQISDWGIYLKRQF